MDTPLDDLTRALLIRKDPRRVVKGVLGHTVCVACADWLRTVYRVDNFTPGDCCWACLEPMTPWPKEE